MNTKIVRVISFFLLTAFAAGAAEAAAKPGATGVGFVLGDPLGPRFKTWLSRSQAIDAGIGLDDDVVLYGDFVFHAWDALPRPQRGSFAPYLGIGPRYEARDHHKDRFGARLPAGLSYFVQGAPLELYFELVPIVQFSPDLDGDLDAGIGVNYYFTGF